MAVIKEVKAYKKAVASETNQRSTSLCDDNATSKIF
jgi:hypothetical protein